MTSRGPRAVVVCSYSPFPVTSGGRKRQVRLLEAMERAGAIPHILTENAVPEGLPELEERGWPIEVFARPKATLGSRARQHGWRDVLPHNPGLANRLNALSRDAAFVQLEEIGAAQYARAHSGRAPLVVSLHNVDSQVAAADRSDGGATQRLRRAYHVRRMISTETRAVRHADVVVCVSEHDRDHFVSLGARECVVARNGVDEELFAIPAHPPPSRSVFFFGQFGWKPNADGALRYVTRVWPKVAAVVPDATLRIAGPGSRDALGSVAAQCDGVEVVGFVPDIGAELASSRVVVAPLWIGGGTRIKVLEALAAGCVVVGTSVGVERLGFIHERHGLISDTDEGLATATARVLTDDVAASRFAQAARKLAQGYGWTTTTSEMGMLYEHWVAATS